MLSSKRQYSGVNETDPSGNTDWY